MRTDAKSVESSKGSKILTFQTILKDQEEEWNMWTSHTEYRRG